MTDDGVSFVVEVVMLLVAFAAWLAVESLTR